VKLTGAEIICKSLIKEGVEVVFGYPGGAILPFYDALYQYPQIHHVLVRHEQAAAHAAEGYARASGKVGVCIATSGPGATNLVTGLLSAKMDSVPIIAITGQVPRPFMGREAFQEGDTISVTRPVTKRNYMALRAQDLGFTIREAFHIAASGRPGPVLIDVPKDVQMEEAEFLYPEVPEAPYMPSSTELGSKLDEAATLLNHSRRPVIIAGRGVLLSGASKELRVLSERANVPVINTLLGLSSFPRNHPLSLGMLGMHGLYWSNMAVENADLVLAVGMRFDDRVTGRPGSFAPNAKVIHIEIELNQINKNVNADVSLLGDARDILSAVIPRVEWQERAEWFQDIATWQKEHPSMLIPDSDRLPPQLVLEKLSEALRKNDNFVAVTGVGQHQMWAAQYLPFQHPDSFITSGGLGTMGYELPAAIGAQIGRPDAVVWSIAGDGGFQMSFHELATAVQEGLPVKIALFNNGSLGMIRQWQELFYEGRYKANSLTGPDFVKLAEAFGIPAIRVSNRNEVASAIEAAMAYPGPFLIDFVVEAQENVYPMVPPGSSLGETVEDPRQGTTVKLKETEDW
jgi:acetolactate synthase-1/2/3 large subunit